MDGHVIARIFPAVKSNKHQTSHHSRNPKPQQAIINPDLLVHDTGHLKYRPKHAILVGSDNRKDTIINQGNATLDVYLYQDCDTDGIVNDAVHFTMNRDSKDLLGKTLTRLEVSMAKKLYDRERNAQSCKIKKRDNQVQLASYASSALPLPIVSKIHPETNQPRDTWDISTLTTGEWILRALETPCMLQLQKPTNGDDTPATLKLLVETCPPTIVGVQTFEEFGACVYVGIPIRIKVETQFADGCSVDWFVIDNGGEARLVAKDCPLFTPTEDLLDASLAILLTPFSQNHDGRGQEEAYQFKRAVKRPSQNIVLQLRTPAWTSPPPSNVLRVVSYNVLADQNAFQTGNQKPFYPYCSKDILERARRLPLILQELVSYHPGIMCLQEVDQIVFESLLQPVLSSLGWEGYFTMKRHAGTREGAAIFWSKERFQVIEQQWFNLGDLSTKLHVRPAGNDWSDTLQTLERLLKSQKSLKYVIKSQLGHVVQLVRLLDRATKQHILVANTHLFYHPDASHVRLIQMLLVSRQISIEVEKDAASKPHIILCGDFNSSLENAAGKLMVDRHVRANFRDLKKHLNTFDFGAAKATSSPQTDYDFPALDLPESFPHLRSGLLEPAPFTHCIDGFRGTLDHILTTMESVQSAPMPALEQVTRNVAMPSEHLPSDHISILCDLKL